MGPQLQILTLTCGDQPHADGRGRGSTNQECWLQENTEQHESMILLKLNFNIILVFAGHLQTLFLGRIQNLIYKTSLTPIQLLLK